MRELIPAFWLLRVAVALLFARVVVSFVLADAAAGRWGWLALDVVLALIAVALIADPAVDAVRVVRGRVERRRMRRRLGISGPADA